MKSCNQVVTFESLDVTVQMTVLTIQMKPSPVLSHIKYLFRMLFSLLKAFGKILWSDHAKPLH